MRLLVHLAVATASATTCALAFPPHPMPLLAWVGYAPLLVVLRRSRSLPQALLVAWAWMTVFAWGVGTWLPRSVSTYYDQTAVVGAVFFFGISTWMAAIYCMAFAVAYRRLGRMPPGVVPVAAAAAWTASEFARAALLTGNPWGLAGYSQVALLPMVQIADLTGVHGVSFAVLFLNAAIAELWLSRAAAGPRWAFASAVLLVAAIRLHGDARLRGPIAEGPAMRTAIVQGNVDVGSQWQPHYYGKHLTTYLALTDEVATASDPDLVVWPEGAMTFFLHDEPLYQRTLARVLRRHGAHLIAGGPRTDGDPARFWNAAFLVTPDGHIAGHYDKQRLLPFAEYFPLPGFEALQRRFARLKAFTPGDETPLLETPAGRAGVLICNETFYGDMARRRVADGAALLVALANDSWVNDPQFSAMVYDMVRLRAVEVRRWVIRASTSGPSGLIDPFGRVVAGTAPASQAVVSGDVYAARGTTPYARVGDVFAWGCVVVTLIGLAWRPADSH